MFLLPYETVLEREREFYEEGATFCFIHTSTYRTHIYLLKELIKSKKEVTKILVILVYTGILSDVRQYFRSFHDKIFLRINFYCKNYSHLCLTLMKKG